MMKKLSKESTLKEAKNEIYFCENYSHRCITKFYGFMKEDAKITGFIYEYMSNGTLDSFLPYHLKEINNTFTITILARIYEGLEYLYSKSLIHRDLKPANILKLLKNKSLCLSQSIFLFNLGDSYQHGKYTK